MAFMNGRELTIRRRISATPPVFANVCQLQSRTLALNNNMIERNITDCDNLAEAPKAARRPGIQSLRFEGTALFQNSVTHKAVATDALNQSLGVYQIAVPGWGVFEGNFYVENVNFAGEIQNDLTMQIAFVPADGDYTFTAVT